jgi:diguanylate cyclase (GGDEF)-like protein
MLKDPTIRLLVVDDDEDDLYLINDALTEVKETRYDVCAVSSALAAMAKLAEVSFDVIVSDYRLGAVTGIDFIKNVRKAGIDTPVILLTGLAANAIDQAALQAGASDFLPKESLNPIVIDRAIRYAIAHANRQRLLQAVLKSTISGVAAIDDRGDITLWNPRFLEFAEAAFGEESGRLDQLARLALAADDQDIEIGGKVVEPYVTKLPDGGSVLVLHDVTERVNDLKQRELAEQRIRQIALHDTLTGLPNRAAFNDLLDCSIYKATEEDRELAVLSFDFDRFKEVNDVFGHAAGDDLLKVAASRLSEILSAGEYVARLGGDEFVLIQERPEGDSARLLAQRLVESLSRPFESGGKSISAEVSVGIAYFPHHGRQREDLLANADLAMYRAKNDPGQSICIFDVEMDQYIRHRRKIATELRSAIQENELHLNFQPQYSAASNSITGFEALLRWTNRLRGPISPNEFIGVAEENGMIREIDEWVLRRACLTAASWNNDMKVAVNISAKAICHSGIAEMVRGILLESGLSPARLELEVTESAFIYDLNRALHTLRQIKALGISIAMDDFGTGYSSLSMLNSFPFDRIKIDKSFIQGIGTSPRAETICRAVLGLGHALQVPILAEGVETREQLDFAVSLGCDEIQGYYFGLPLSEQEVMDTYGNPGGVRLIQAPKVAAVA